MCLLRVHPEGSLGIEFDGRIVATTTLVCYEDQLAWLGMVLTHPAYRRRGFARRLVEHALGIAMEKKKIRTVKLDATEQGRPLYESLGFRVEQTIERWSGSSVISNGAAARHGTPDFELDREAFGANRRRLLGILSVDSLPVVNENGFALWRPGRCKSYVGPCVARSPEAAKSLIESCLRTRLGAWYWDLFPSNIQAADIAEELGFEKERTLARMTAGVDLRGCESMIYAGGGFELG
jgi:RimJ/RimL family protein N-acetyltransferase